MPDAGDPGLRALEKAGVERFLEAGAILWQAGDAGISAAYLLEGVLEVIGESEDGELLVLRRVDSGTLLGEMSALEGTTHSATVRAVAPSRVRIISAGALQQLVAAHPALALTLLRAQSERVRALSGQVSVLAFESVVRRVARHLLARAEAGELRLGVTHQEIGERVAATRESVTKALGALVRCGAVRLRRGEVEICDIDVLREAVG
ncbi:MAG: Crp/Fnr family transcriptional regulator [Proteobacteria bacterium]|nr:Crp/Fnr family transcriptional regulator [Pseudomonadota bacterium]